MLTPARRKFLLLLHLTFALGWLGAVLAYLALAITGMTGLELPKARVIYFALELIGWKVVVPLSFATLITGLIQGLGTRWGLFRHWWVVTKFVLTIVAIVILLVHMQQVSQNMRSWEDVGLVKRDFRPELLHSAGGLLVLLATSALSVYKPWGMTPYGRRQAPRAGIHGRRGDSSSSVREVVHPAALPTAGPR